MTCEELKGKRMLVASSSSGTRQGGFVVQEIGEDMLRPRVDYKGV